MKACHVRFFILTILVFVWLSIPVYSQIQITSPFKFLEISPTYPLPAWTESMGNLEFAVEDSTRDPFINPAKLHLIHQPHIFLSATLAGVNDRIINTHELKTNKTRRTRLTRQYNRLLPAGVLFSYRKIYMGILGYFYQNGDKSEIKDDNKFNNKETTNILMKWDLSGNSFPFQIVTGVQISPKLFVAAGLKRFRSEASGSFFTNKTNYDRNTENQETVYQAATHYKISEKHRLYFGVSRYKIFRKLSDNPGTSSETGFDDNQDGWAFQMEYHHRFTKNTSFSGRVTLDFRDTKHSQYHPIVVRTASTDIFQQTEEGNATLLELGIGGSHRQGRLTIAGEVLLLPAKFKSEETLYSQSFGKKSEYTLLQWQVKLGIDIQMKKWLSWQLGMNYSAFRNRQQYKIQDSRNITDPFQKIGNTRLTTGLRFTFRKFEVVYHFSYYQQPFPNFTIVDEGYSYLNYGFSPITHRINIVYYLNRP